MIRKHVHLDNVDLKIWGNLPEKKEAIVLSTR